MASLENTGDLIAPMPYAGKDLEPEPKSDQYVFANVCQFHTWTNQICRGGATFPPFILDHGHQGKISPFALGVHVILLIFKLSAIHLWLNKGKTMKTKTIVLTMLLALTWLWQGFSQGFINLNFESANVSAYGQGPAVIPTINGIPGWTAYMDGAQTTSMFYNTESLGAEAIDLEGTNNDAHYPPIQGNYFILLQGDTAGEGISAAIGQTGQIPTNAKSMTYMGNVGYGNVTFAGNNLPVTEIGTSGSYGIFQADVSIYAGDTGQLLFTAYSGQFDFLDNIQFSPNPVPEPSALGLSALGSLFFAWHRWKARAV